MLKNNKFRLFLLGILTILSLFVSIQLSQATKYYASITDEVIIEQNDCYSEEYIQDNYWDLYNSSWYEENTRINFKGIRTGTDAYINDFFSLAAYDERWGVGMGNLGATFATDSPIEKGKFYLNDSVGNIYTKYLKIYNRFTGKHVCNLTFENPIGDNTFDVGTILEFIISIGNGRHKIYIEDETFNLTSDLSYFSFQKYSEFWEVSYRPMDNLSHVETAHVDFMPGSVDGEIMERVHFCQYNTTISDKFIFRIHAFDSNIYFPIDLDYYTVDGEWLWDENNEYNQFDIWEYELATKYTIDTLDNKSYIWDAHESPGYEFQTDSYGNLGKSMIPYNINNRTYFANSFNGTEYVLKVDYDNTKNYTFIINADQHSGGDYYWHIADGAFLEYGVNRQIGEDGNGLRIFPYTSTDKKVIPTSLSYNLTMFIEFFSINDNDFIRYFIPQLQFDEIFKREYSSIFDNNYLEIFAVDCQFTYYEGGISEVYGLNEVLYEEDFEDETIGSEPSDMIIEKVAGATANVVGNEDNKYWYVNDNTNDPVTGEDYSLRSIFYFNTLSSNIQYSFDITWNDSHVETSPTVYNKIEWSGGFNTFRYKGNSTDMVIQFYAGSYEDIFTESEFKWYNMKINFSRNGFHDSITKDNTETEELDHSSSDSTIKFNRISFACLEVGKMEFYYDNITVINTVPYRNYKHTGVIDQLVPLEYGVKELSKSQTFDISTPTFANDSTHYGLWKKMVYSDINISYNQNPQTEKPILTLNQTFDVKAYNWTYDYLGYIENFPDNIHLESSNITNNTQLSFTDLEISIDVKLETFSSPNNCVHNLTINFQSYWELWISKRNESIYKFIIELIAPFFMFVVFPIVFSKMFHKRTIMGIGIGFIMGFIILTINGTIDKIAGTMLTIVSLVGTYIIYKNEENNGGIENGNI